MISATKEAALLFQVYLNTIGLSGPYSSFLDDCIIFCEQLSHLNFIVFRANAARGI